MDKLSTSGALKSSHSKLNVHKVSALNQRSSLQSVGHIVTSKMYPVRKIEAGVFGATNLAQRTLVPDSRVPHQYINSASKLYYKSYIS